MRPPAAQDSRLMDEFLQEGEATMTKDELQGYLKNSR